jgi:UDP-N-acetylmuramate--alanine ligase
VVSVADQRLYLLQDHRLVAEYPVSTAAAGVGGAEGSNRTPPGLHRVHQKYGAGQPVGMVFVERVPTGRIWRGEAGSDDLILTRVLTLDGLEPGVNQGAGCDSLGRWIYIHGTNHEDRLGSPVSHGCIRVANRDVVELFERLEPGDHVLIA